MIYKCAKEKGFAKPVNIPKEVRKFSADHKDGNLKNNIFKGIIKITALMLKFFKSSHKHAV